MEAVNMPREPAYELTHDVARFSSYEVNYYADLLIRDDPLGGGTDIFREDPIEITAPVVYSGYPPVVRTLDFPVTDNSWLVMSSRMLNVLRSVGEFQHLEFEVVVADDRHLSAKWRDVKGRFYEEMIMRGFSAVQLLEHADIFDFERSEYRHDPDFPAFIGNVDRYVFRIPEEGLPPIFHIKGEPVKTFVSHKARMALKKAGITGIEYISLKGIRNGSEGMYVDVPVPDPLDD
jgi:hypothetical protein